MQELSHTHLRKECAKNHKNQCGTERKKGDGPLDFSSSEQSFSDTASRTRPMGRVRFIRTYTVYPGPTVSRRAAILPLGNDLQVWHR